MKKELIDEYKTLLKEFLKFKSVSADKSFDKEILKTVEWLKATFEENNFDVEIIYGYDNPIVIANYTVDENLDTSLIYGHYDVQPADEPDWENDPFDLDEREGKLFGRGVMDNKGQTLIHMVTIFQLIRERKLKYNIEFLLEGNEETGSPHIEDFIKENKKKVEADFILISDGTLLHKKPVIEAGFRGIVNLELEIKTSNKDIHSGMYGTSAPNAIHELSKIISKFYDETNKIQVPDFYENVLEIEKEIRSDLLNIEFSEEKFREETGTKAMLNEHGENFYTQTGTRPTIQVTGIYGGYISDGIKTIIPGKAYAKINVRIVENQKPKEIYEKVKKFIESIAPDYVDFKLKFDEGVSAVSFNLHNKFINEAKEKLIRVYEAEPTQYFIGGSIPIVKYFKEYLKIPILSIPLGSEHSNMHGANENFKLSKIKKGLEFSYYFFRN